VDFPWSMWAMMQKFRITDGSVEPGLWTGTDVLTKGAPEGATGANLGLGPAYG